MHTRQNIAESPLLIAYTSDWHIRATQYARKSRGEDFAKAAINAAHKIVESECDIAINCGDIFNVSRPTANDIATLIQVDKVLREGNKPMYTITGNHDMTNPTWLETLFPGRVVNGKPERRGIIPCDNKTVIHPATSSTASLTISNITPKSRAEFRAIKQAGEFPPADIFLYHILVADFMPFKDDAMYTLKDLPMEQYKAILLGDVHFCDIRVDEATGCLTGYPGSIEMCSASEPLNKLMPILAWDGEKLRMRGKIDLEIRPYIVRTLSEEDDLEQLIHELKAIRDKHPVVICKYSTEINSVIPRIYSTLDAGKAVVKLTPLPNASVDLTDVRAKSRMEEDKTLEEFVIDMLEHYNEDLVNMCCEVAKNCDIDVHDRITSYVTKRTQELENANN